MQLSLAPDDILLAIPRQTPAVRAFALAVVMHGLLFVFFYFGLHWQTSTPPAVEAELWSALPQFEAPKPVEIVPEKPIETPIEKPIEKPITPPKVVEAIVKPDIALEQEKKRKEKLKQDEQQKRELEAKKEKEKEREKQEKLKDEALKQKFKAAEEARLGIGKKPTATGTATQTSGASGEWSAVVAAAIRANINNPTDLKGNPAAIFQINLLPSGEMIGAPKLLQSSGFKSYDEAVERAIRKTDPLPRPKNGIFERELKLTFRPQDQPR